MANIQVINVGNERKHGQHAQVTNHHVFTEIFQGLKVEDVGMEGEGLVFIVYRWEKNFPFSDCLDFLFSDAIASMPFSFFWAIIFFFMLITLGLDRFTFRIIRSLKFNLTLILCSWHHGILLWMWCYMLNWRIKVLLVLIIMPILVVMSHFDERISVCKVATVGAFFRLRHP